MKRLFYIDSGKQKLSFVISSLQFTNCVSAEEIFLVVDVYACMYLLHLDVFFIWEIENPLRSSFDLYIKSVPNY